ncbi:MAG: hypothetical protein WC732_03530 [Candidatus Omnitrophota bacterium]
MSAVCPHCSKPVNDPEALFCLFCGSPLKKPAGFLGALKFGAWKYAAIALLALLIAVLICAQVFSSAFAAMEKTF